MRKQIVEIISIGREVLDGRVVDSNSTRMAELIAPLGLVPRYAQKVDDDLTRMQEAFAIAQKRSQIILVSGGLGPTSDDLTAQAFADFLKTKLELNQQAKLQIEAMFHKMNRPLSQIQYKQAYLPVGSKVLINQVGTAPGFGYTNKDLEQNWYFFPGVPLEMEWILKNEVLRLLPKVNNYQSRTWATQFTSEGKLQEQLTEVEKKLAYDFEISYRTRYPENFIALYGSCDSSAQQNLFNELSQHIEQILGASCYAQATHPDSCPKLEQVVIDLLNQQQAWLATVESCTGGLIAHRITEIAGASNVFWGTFNSYHNSFKEKILAVKTLAEHGAVAAPTAIAMAEAGLQQMVAALADHRPYYFCLATTGIAGPGGGSAAKPVGLCYVALAGLKLSAQTLVKIPTQVIEVRGLAHLDRSRLKLLFSQKALDLLRLTCLELSSSPVKNSTES